MTVADEHCAWLDSWASLPSLEDDSPFNDLSYFLSKLRPDKQESKEPFLEQLSCLLLCLSSAVSSNNYCCSDLSSISFCIRGVSIAIKFNDARSIYNLLFKKFHNGIQMIFAALHSTYNSNICHEHLKDLHWYLRCWIRILPLLEFDTMLNLLATQRLVSQFEDLCSPSFLDKVLEYCGRTWMPSGCKITNRQTVYYLSEILEVFIDELILHPELGKSLTNTDFHEGRSGSILGKHVDCVLQTLFVNCLLLSECKISTFTPPSCNVENLNLSSKISIPAASFLCDIFLRVNNQIFLVYALTMVSKAICNTHTPCYGDLPLETVIAFLISILESSLELYTNHVSMKEREGSKCLEDLALESCLIGYLNHQTRLDLNSDYLTTITWDAGGCADDSSDQGDNNSLYWLFKCLCAYIQGDDNYEGDICYEGSNDILKQLVISAFARASEGKIMSEKKCSREDTLILASIIQVLDSALQRLLPFFGKNRDLQLSDDSYNPSACYVSLMGTLVYPVQRKCPMHAIGILVNDVMKESNTYTQKSVGAALGYFSSELCLNFQSESVILCRGYIDVIRTLVQVIALEEGGKSTLKILLSQLEADAAFHHFYLNSSLSLEKVITPARPLSVKPSPQVESLVAGFLRKRQLVLQGNRQTDSEEEIDIDQENENDCKTSVKTSASDQNPFLEATRKIWPLEFDRDDDEYRDLADFIVCKKGRDYNKWLIRKEKKQKKKSQQQFFRREESRKGLLQLLQSEKV